MSEAQEATGSGGMEPSLNERSSVGGENLVLQVALPWGQRVWIELPAPRLHGLALQSPHQQNKVVCVRSITQSCPTLCDPMDCSLPCSSIHGISQARVLEWGCHFLLQGLFLTQGLSPPSPALAGAVFTTEPRGKPQIKFYPPLKGVRIEGGNACRVLESHV